MTESYPVNPARLQDFYEKIRPIVESSTGLEPQLAIEDLSPTLFKDMRREAEMLMLLHGQGTSDRYLYGMCSAVAAMREENGGSLPTLNDEQYELDREVQDSHRAAQDEAAADYFIALEERFRRMFPLSTAILAIMENDLRTRLRVPESDIQDGFVAGRHRALRAVMPLFAEDEPAEA